MFKDKTIAITGITGSWGHELTKQLLEKGVKKIIGISRGELQQVLMQRKFNNDKIEFKIADVRSLNRMSELFQNVDIVFHLAAQKHVPVCEDNPWESVNTNIIGVENVIRASISNNVETVIDVSTDKACNPLNHYGACKSVGEKLMISANYREGNTKFVCVRAGNVIGSNGSVIPFFEKLASQGKELPITDTEMTRYLMSLPQAIDLLFKAVNKAFGGEIFVTKMPAANLYSLAKVIWEHYNVSEMHYKVVGTRPGEKKHEMLVSEHESNSTVEDDDFRIILPMNHLLDDNYKNSIPMREKEYTSNQSLMTEDEIKLIIKSAGCLK